MPQLNHHHHRPASTVPGTLRRAARRMIRWTCGTCGAVNPPITGSCIRCGQG